MLLLIFVVYAVGLPASFGYYLFLNLMDQTSSVEIDWLVFSTLLWPVTLTRSIYCQATGGCDDAVK